MSRSDSASAGSAGDEIPSCVFGCLSDQAAVRRLDRAMRPDTRVLWWPTFAKLREGLTHESCHVVTVVVGLEDSTGASAVAFAQAMAQNHPGTGIVVHRAESKGSQADLCALGAAGVHDILIAGITDDGHVARQIIRDACRRGAAELVLREVARLVPRRLLPFVQAAIRNPAKSSVTLIAQHLDIHRQTPNWWCREERYLRPEELLVWSRLFLVAALLELTSRTLDSIANDLDYASPTALRNQLKKYTGLTATEVRAAGMDAVFNVFSGRVAQVQGGYAGATDRGAASREPVSLRSRESMRSG
jgi:AraC-like DNA-binding protein